jgi:hypothetical protein
LTKIDPKPPLGMRGNFVSNYTSTEIAEQKVIRGEDEIPLRK